MRQRMRGKAIIHGGDHLIKKRKNENCQVHKKLNLCKAKS
jgi:hypothetical protein